MLKEVFISVQYIKNIIYELLFEKIFKGLFIIYYYFFLIKKI